MKQTAAYLAFCSVMLCLSLVIGLMTPPAAVAVGTGSASITVVLDAGHGGMDAGAVSADGVYEKDLNLLYAQTLASMLQKAGANVIMTRTEDALVLKEGEDVKGQRKKHDLANRLAVANAYPDAILVSIHMNSYPSPQYDGFQVYYAQTEGSASLAARMHANIKQGLLPENRRTEKAATSSIYLLHHAETVAVLVECGFLSHPEEARKLSDEDYRKELCFLLFCAIMDKEPKDFGR